jgi:hypothetical protein
MIMSEFFDMLVQERQKIKVKKFKSPCKKSPLKAQKENDENCSPEKSPYKEERGSQKRRKNDDEVSSIYLQEIKSESSDSPEKKSCRKSPLKRMRNLEAMDNLENQENIEATYAKSPAKILRGGESPMSEEVLKATDESQEQLETPKEFSIKTLLGSSHQAIV